MTFLKKLGIKKRNSGSSTGISWDSDKSGAKISIISPVDGKIIGSVFSTPPKAYEKVLHDACTQTR